MVPQEVYLPDPQAFELRPFQDRVLELVRLFHTSPCVRLRVIGTIAAGEPIEAIPESDDAIELHEPTSVLQHHPLLPLLRAHLCPALQSVSGDVFEIARVVTPVLVGLRLSGKVPIDLDPWIFAGVALMVVRMGIAEFCAEHTTDDKTQ